MVVIPAFLVVHVIVMVLLTLINVGATQARTSSNFAREARRLRIALEAELRELLWLHDRNLDHLRSGKPYLLSSRACTAVFKGNVGKLISMTDNQIAPLVRAYAATEQAEHLIAATTKPHGPMAFRIEKETPVEELIDEITRAQHAIGEAVDIMTPPPTEAPAGLALRQPFAGPALDEASPAAAQ